MLGGPVGSADDAGHKELHKPVLHVPQLFYFLAFCSVMLLPALIAEGPRRTLGGAAGLAVGSGSGWKIAGVVGGWGAMVALVRKYECVLSLAPSGYILRPLLSFGHAAFGLDWRAECEC